MALRLSAIAVGAQYGVTETVAAIVVAQVIATRPRSGSRASPPFAAFPAAPADVARRRPPRHPSPSSSSRACATGVVSLRGDARAAPARDRRQRRPGRATSASRRRRSRACDAARRRRGMILLTEQTRDWERGRARQGAAPACGATALWAAGADGGRDRAAARAHAGARSTAVLRRAVRAARPTLRGIVLVAAVLQFVFGWTKSFPVSIGRPSLRDLDARGRDGRARPARARCSARAGGRPAPPRVLASTVVFALPGPCSSARQPRAARRRRRARRGRGAVNVLVVSGIWPPDVGGPASHAPDVAAFLLGARACASRS